MRAGSGGIAASRITNVWGNAADFSRYSGGAGFSEREVRLCDNLPYAPLSYVGVAAVLFAHVCVCVCLPFCAALFMRIIEILNAYA